MSYQSRDRLSAPTDLYATAAAPKAGLRQRLALSWAVWRERTAMRRCLAQMDARSLRDAGISPAAAAYEIGQAILGEDRLPALRSSKRHKIVTFPLATLRLVRPLRSRACAVAIDRVVAGGVFNRVPVASGPEINAQGELAEWHRRTSTGNLRCFSTSTALCSRSPRHPSWSWFRPPCQRCLPICTISSTGAVAIVSGRPIGQIDRLLTPFLASAAGEHGVSIRYSDGTLEELPVGIAVPDTWREALNGAVERWPGVRVETKPHGVAVHYRLAPERENEVWELVRALVAARSSVVSPDSGPRGGRDRSARGVQGPCGRAPDGACAVPWPQADLHRRRFHRRGRHEHGAPLRRAGPARR